MIERAQIAEINLTEQWFLACHFPDVRTSCHRRHDLVCNLAPSFASNRMKNSIEERINYERGKTATES
ncbi:hypothetical protein, partial [Caldilinea sp.]|uniref:hypothetical protein n=1 Tax=Caldilinea sp. TaxID=2293560 RepID=UPI001B231084